MGFTPRTRSRIQATPVVDFQHLEYYTYIGGPPLYPMGWKMDPNPIYGPNRLLTTEHQTMSDVTMDKGSGRPIDNPLTVVKSKREYVDGHIRQSNSTVNNYVSPWRIVAPGLPSRLSGPIDPDYGQYLVSDCLEKIAKKANIQQAVPMLPFIGELHSCIEMVRNPFAFLSTWNPSKHRKGDSLARTLQRNGLSVASDGWLTYKYGWKPLFSDLVAFGQLALNFDEEYSAYLSGVAKPKKERTTVRASSACRNVPFTGSGSIVEGSHTQAVTIDWTIQPSAEVLTKSQYLRRRLGLSPLDIASAAWELVPYSFVVDWFLPIGSFLQDIAHTPVEFAVVGKYFTHKASGNLKYYVRDSSFSGNPGSGTLQQVFSDDCEEFSRGAIDLIPGPGSPAPITQRVISALSLIEQRFRLPTHR